MRDIGMRMPLRANPDFACAPSGLQELSLSFATRYFARSFTGSFTFSNLAISTLRTSPPTFSTRRM